jgi:hypothetical protein
VILCSPAKPQPNTHPTLEEENEEEEDEDENEEAEENEEVRICASRDDFGRYW